MTTGTITFCPGCSLPLAVCVCLPCQSPACHGFHRGCTRPCDHCQAGVPGSVSGAGSGAVTGTFGHPLYSGPHGDYTVHATGTCYACTPADDPYWNLPMGPYWEAVNAAIQEELDAMREGEK